MKNISTRSTSTEVKSAESTDPSRHQSDSTSLPRRSTVLFLRQFARAYSCTASVPVAIGGFVAN